MEFSFIVRMDVSCVVMFLNRRLKLCQIFFPSFLMPRYLTKPRVVLVAPRLTSHA